MNEVLNLLDRISEVDANTNVDTLMIFFREHPSALHWEIKAVVRMKRWNTLSLDDKTINYSPSLESVLNKIKTQSQSNKFGFLNFIEAVGVIDGSLQTKLAGTLREGKVSAKTFYDIDFLPQGKLKISELPLSE